METIFDKILSGAIPAKKIYEDEFVLSFADINPQAKVHVLVIPKSKLQSFVNVKDTDATLLGKFMQGISNTAHGILDFSTGATKTSI